MELVDLVCAVYTLFIYRFPKLDRFCHKLPTIDFSDTSNCTFASSHAHITYIDLLSHKLSLLKQHLQTSTSTHLHNMNSVASSISSLISYSLTNSTLDLPLDDEYCDGLDFFVKILYLLTGDCSLHLTRKELILYLKPVSEWSGYISITAWLFAQLPQVIKNYSEKSVEGLSIGFLLCWFGGDFLNFTSCVLTDAMAFQLLLSSYYCIVDLILAGQFYYYSQLYHNPGSRFYHKKRIQKLKPMLSPRSMLRESLSKDDDNKKAIIEIDIDTDNVKKIASVPLEHISRPIIIDEQLLRQEGSSSSSSSSFSNNDSRGGIPIKSDNRRATVLRLPNNSIGRLVSSSFVMGFSKAQGFPINQLININKDDKKVNNSILHRIIYWFLTMNSYKFGKIFAWSCTCLYLTSRIPQLITNYELKSTKGVSLKLIMCALLGNLFYAISLSTCKSALVGGDTTREFWDAELSYLIGSLGTVSFDICVLMQWYKWDYKGKKQPHQKKFINHQLQQQQSEQAENTRLALLGLKSPNIDDASSPINFTTPLSPNHVRKLSEHTPLSPMDFLLDDFMSQARSLHNNNNTNHSSPLLVSHHHQQILQNIKNNYNTHTLHGNHGNMPQLLSQHQQKAGSIRSLSRHTSGGLSSGLSSSTHLQMTSTFSTGPNSVDNDELNQHLMFGNANSNLNSDNDDRTLSGNSWTGSKSGSQIGGLTSQQKLTSKKSNLSAKLQKSSTNYGSASTS